MTAACRFEPEFCTRVYDSAEMQDIKSVMKQISTDEHTYPALLAELEDFKESLMCGANDLNDA
eukprot:scaffold330570_cov67-Tisochrysis_lutea.AAC.1